MNLHAENITEQKQFTILIIEDDKNLAYLIQKKLKRIGHNTEIMYTGNEALSYIEENDPSLLLMDYRLVDMSGKEIISSLLEKNIKIPFIIMTGFGDEKIAVEMMKLGAVDYLVKDQNFLEILIPVVEKVKDQINLGQKLTETQEHLRKSEIRFRTLIENSTDITMIFDKNGQIIYQSPSVKTILGYSQEEISGKNFFDLIHPEDIETVKLVFNNIIKYHKTHNNFEFRVKSFNGTFRYLEGTFNNLLDDPNIKGILTNLRDISIRISAEEEIRRLSLAVQQSPAAIMITTEDGTIEYVNPKFTEISGYSFDEIKGQNPRILKSGNTDPVIYTQLWNTIKAGKTWRGEVQNKDKTGNLFWESISISPIIDKKNRITHYIGIKEDITEKKKYVEKIKRANEFYLNLFEDSPTMIWRCKKDGYRDYFNQTWLKFRGFTQQEEIEEGWIAGIHPDDKDTYLANISNAFKNKEPVRSLFRLKRFNEEYRWINEICKPYYDLEGYFAGMIGTCIDVTENKLAEEAMRKAKDEAEKSEALKTEFLAQMSHEIRTPINAILSFTSLLRYELEESVDEDLRESFRIIDQGGRRLIRTIDLLLHMSEIQTGNYEITKKEKDLQNDVIDNVVSELSPLALTRGININIKNECENLIVKVDEHSIMQIFENLVDNAIKYNKEEGNIDILMYELNGGKIAVDIKDEGIGISQEFLPNLFEPFTQEEQGYTRKFEGNGLGLALVKKYCEINDAEIKVESKKGVGTKFTVVLSR